MASALLSRLFDLMIGFTDSGWLRRIETSEILIPSRTTRAGGSSRGLTMMTSDGVGVAQVVAQLADAARQQDPDIGLV